MTTLSSLVKDISYSNILSKPTTVASFGIIDAAPLVAPVFTGTPSFKMAQDAGLVGAELIVNGAFATNTGWTYGTASWSWLAGGYVEYNAVTGLGGSLIYGTTITVVAGQTYRLSYSLTATSANNVYITPNLIVGGQTVSGCQVILEPINVVHAEAVIFTAPASGAATLSFTAVNATALGVARIDNVSLKQIDRDNTPVIQLKDINNATFELRCYDEYSFALGRESLSFWSVGNNNYAFGYYALRNLSTGTSNIALGTRALQNNVNGLDTIAIGVNSQMTISSPINNISIGTGALKNTQCGRSNTIIGINANILSTSGNYNTSIGWFSNHANITGDHNVSYGSQANGFGANANKCTAVGQAALRNNVGSNNVAIGAHAGWACVNGSNNTYLGFRSGNTFVTISEVLTFGAPTQGSGYVNGTYLNVPLTYLSGVRPTNFPRVDIVVAGGKVTSCVLTTANVDFKGGNGFTAAPAVTATTAATGAAGTVTLTFAAKTLPPYAIGSQIIVAGITPVGYNGTFTVTACTTTTVSYTNATTGAQTIAGTITQGISVMTCAAASIGGAGTGFAISPATTTASGSYALTGMTYTITIVNGIVTDSNLGLTAGVAGLFKVMNIASISNIYNIGLNADYVFYNDGIHTSFYFGSADLGTSLVNAVITVQAYTNTGSAISNVTCIGAYSINPSLANEIQIGTSGSVMNHYGVLSTTSDARDKAEIRDTILGLNFISKLHPVDFKWDYREDYFEEITVSDQGQPYSYRNAIQKDGSKTRTRFHHGIIAQELKAVIDDLGVDFGGYQDKTVNGGADILTLSYSELIGPMIKAIQELDIEIAILEEVV